MSKKNIIMVGPFPRIYGGVSVVIGMLLDSTLQDKYNVLNVSTCIANQNYLKAIKIFLGALMFYIFALLKTKSPIVHIHLSHKGSFYRKILIFIIAKLFRSKTIIHLHGAEFEKFMTKNRIFSFLTKYVFNNADVVFVLSNLWKKKLEQFSTNKNIVVLYNPITLFESKKRNTDKVVILFLGRLGKRKGVYDLLDCIIMNKDYFAKKNVRFVLAGDGDVEIVRGIAKKEHLEGIVEIPGWASGAQKEEYLKTSDILILPSYNEQMPLSVLEGMAYGYPIVSTNIAGIPEMVEHGGNGFLTEPGDIEKMTEALKKLCEDKDMRERMGKRSRKIVSEKFESKLIIKKLINVYQEL